MKHVGPFTMRLRSAGNPDFGQYAPMSEPETFTGETLAAMRAKAEAYRDFWDLGGGNWVSPVVKDAQGKVVGHFSYNGRLWKGRPARNIERALAKEEILIDQEAVLVRKDARYAYAPIVERTGYTLGRADEGTKGYTPVPGARFGSYEAARKEADERNAKLGLSKREAAAIILGTMWEGVPR